MTKKQEIQLFEEKKVRTVWDPETEQWYFCVVDVVEVLTDSVNPNDYIKKMKKRDPSLAEGWGQIVTPPFCANPRRQTKGQLRFSTGAFPPHPIHSVSKSRTVQNLDGAGGQGGWQRCESRTKTIGKQNRQVGHFSIKGKCLSVADGGRERIKEESTTSSTPNTGPIGTQDSRSER